MLLVQGKGGKGRKGKRIGGEKNHMHRGHDLGGWAGRFDVHRLTRGSRSGNDNRRNSSSVRRLLQRMKSTVTSQVRPQVVCSVLLHVGLLSGCFGGSRTIKLCEDRGIETPFQLMGLQVWVQCQQLSQASNSGPHFTAQLKEHRRSFQRKQWRGLEELASLLNALPIPPRIESSYRAARGWGKL